MSPLAAIERFFERLFERPSARLFRTHVQPIQIQRRIERAMEAGRRPAADRRLAPNRFIVHLNPEDLAGFADVADGLASGLADEALAFARAHHYALIERPRVDLVPDPTVPRADIRIDARVTAAVPGSSQDPDEAVARAATTVFTLPTPTIPRATLRVTDPDGHARDISIGPGGLTIGRAGDNDLVARDVRVSRHHGRIAGRRGTLIYQDLGSTNGSRVNGEPVTEVVLGVGDTLQVGDTMIRVEVGEAPG